MLIQNLPRWLLLSAFLLAMNAGMINVLGLFSLLHQSVSHMTGNVSLVADALIQQQYGHVLYLLLVNLSSMKYFSFLASFGKLAYLDLSNKPL